MTIHRLALALACLAPLLAGCADHDVAPPAATMRFEFHSAFLMNLHHFLADAARHPGRLDAVKWDVAPTAEESAALHDAVAFYTTRFGKRSLLFDDDLRDIKHALARADDTTRQADGLGLPPALAAMLDRAAPAYARCLWASQDHMNRDWIARVQVLEARYGALIQPRLERIFESRFPTSIRDDIVVTTGTVTGAYTDTPPPLTVMPSGWDEYDGLASLEMIWHEAAHAGPSDRLEQAIETEARATRRVLPEDLWHAALFDAVGVEVQRVLQQQSGLAYVQYAEKNGVYTRAWPQYLPLLQTDWQAWIDGRGSLRAAVAAMVAKQPALALNDASRSRAN
jgi:hypothetical protein